MLRLISRSSPMIARVARFVCQCAPSRTALRWFLVSPRMFRSAAFRWVNRNCPQSNRIIEDRRALLTFTRFRKNRTNRIIFFFFQAKASGMSHWAAETCIKILLFSPLLSLLTFFCGSSVQRKKNLSRFEIFYEDDVMKEKK